MCFRLEVIIQLMLHNNIKLQQGMHEVSIYGCDVLKGHGVDFGVAAL